MRTPSAQRSTGAVLWITPDFPPAVGGIQILTHRLSSLSGHASEVVALPGPGCAAFDARQATPAHRPRAPAGPHRARLAALNAAALGAARSLRPSVVVSAHIVTAPAARVIRRLWGVPYVQVLYADEVTAQPRLSRLAVRGAARTVAISEYTRTLALGVGCAPARLVVIPPGADPPAVAPSGERAPGRIVTVARLRDRYKGHDVMLAALPAVISAVPDACWDVVGDGPLRGELEGRAATLGLASRVRFTGAVPDEERSRLLFGARVFAMPSRLPPGGGGEGFGIAFVEAGRHGLPVVAGAVGGALDAVTPETGLLVDPTDAGAVAAALVRLLCDPANAAAMGAAGRRRGEGYAWPRIAARFDAVVAEAGEERGR